VGRRMASPRTVTVRGVGLRQMVHRSTHVLGHRRSQVEKTAREYRPLDIKASVLHSSRHRSRRPSARAAVAATDNARRAPELSLLARRNSEQYACWRRQGRERPMPRWYRPARRNREGVLHAHLGTSQTIRSHDATRGPPGKIRAGLSRFPNPDSRPARRDPGRFPRGAIRERYAGT
jgi:hypothetical protein